MKSTAIVLLTVSTVFFAVLNFIPRNPKMKTVYLTNREVITLTKECEDAGLEAVTKPQYPQGGDITKVSCRPRYGSSLTGGNEIKKSNITNVTVEK